MILVKGNKKLEIKVCNNIFNRFIGFMFKKNINYGICFPRCNSIHTFFMKECIDVIMTDKNYNIICIFKNLKPNKIILPKKNTYYTFEIPVNKLNLKENEKLQVK